MLYRVKYVDNSEELVEADSITEARKEAKCLYDCPVKHVIVQDPHDCDDDDETDEDEDEDEDDEEEKEDDEDESEDDDDA